MYRLDVDVGVTVLLVFAYTEELDERLDIVETEDSELEVVLETEYVEDSETELDVDRIEVDDSVYTELEPDKTEDNVELSVGLTVDEELNSEEVLELKTLELVVVPPH